MLRELKKSMKVIIIIFLAFFIMSVFLIGVAGVDWGRIGKNYVVKVNDSKVKYQKLALIQFMYKNYYDNIMGYLTEQEAAMYEYNPELNSNLDILSYEYFEKFAFNNLVQNEIILLEAKNKNIKVSSADIEKTYKEKYQGIFGTPNYERWLNYNRINKRDVKNSVKENLIIEKYVTLLEEQYNPDENEIKEFYNENKYSKYLNKEYDEIKDTVKEDFKNMNKQAYVQGVLDEKRKNAKVDIIAEYQRLFNSDAIQLEGVIVSEVDFYNVVLSKLINEFRSISSKKTLYNNVIEEYKEKIAIYNEAKKRELTIDNSLSNEGKYVYASRELRKNIANKVEFNEKDIENYFELNKERYSTQETADIKVIYLALTPTEKDKEIKNMVKELRASHILVRVDENLDKKEKDNLKKKAESLLTKAKDKKTDFSQLAIDNSEDEGSKHNGGDLNFFRKGVMVKAFEDAVFSAKVGEVYSKLVKTDYGYHIIKVTDEREVEGEPVASEETKTALNVKSEEILAKLLAENSDFNAISEEYSELKSNEVNNLRNTGYISNEIGYNKQLSEDIFKMKVDETKIIKTEKGNYIVKLTKYVPYEAAKLESIKDRVISDYKDFEGYKVYNDLKKELVKNINVNIISDNIKDIIE